MGKILSSFCSQKIRKKITFPKQSGFQAQPPGKVEFLREKSFVSNLKTWVSHSDLNPHQSIGFPVGQPHAKGVPETRG